MLIIGLMVKVSQYEYDLKKRLSLVCVCVHIYKFRYFKQKIFYKKKFVIITIIPCKIGN